MKILYVVEHYHPYIGGVEKLFKSLAEEVAILGNEVTVVTTKHKKNLPSKEIVNGVAIRRLPLKNRYIFSFFGWIWILKHAIGKDLIHTTSYNAALPAFFTALFTGKKVIITFHEVWGKQWFKVPFLANWERWAFYLYEWFILKLPFQKFVGVSEFTFQELCARKSPKRVVKILNGLDYKTIQNSSKPEKFEGFNYLFFGRLGVSKGIDIMIEGASLFNKNSEGVFHFVLPKYPKPMRKKVLDLLKTYNIKNVKVYHELPFNELLALIEKVSCVVVPSLSEGFGFSAAECAAKGIPIISSEKGALPEVTYGKVLPIHPYSAEGLAIALKKAKNGEWNQKAERHFPLSKTVSEYLQLYKAMV